MSQLDAHKKRAKQLVRWHRDRNHSVAGRIRRLQRYAHLSDREVLGLDFSLHEAQEIVALEEGHGSWAALRASTEGGEPVTNTIAQQPELNRAVPVMFVANVEASARFYCDSLGFSIDFLHGQPPFYGSVSRDGACIHLKFVHDPVLSVGTHDRAGMIMTFVEVDDVKALFAEYLARNVPVAQRLRTEAWGGRDFIVQDPDGNMICFAGASEVELSARADDADTVAHSRGG